MVSKTMSVSKGQPARKSHRRVDRSEDPAHITTGGHGPHLLVSSAVAKRVVVNALAYYLKRDDLSTSETDTGLAIQLQLIRELQNG